MIKRLGDSLYRGVEFGIHHDDDGDWEWTYYPTIGLGIRTRGKVKGTREAAIAACKLAIDEWLGPVPSQPSELSSARPFSGAPHASFA
jgi:hypothetical protein